MNLFSVRRVLCFGVFLLGFMTVVLAAEPPAATPVVAPPALTEPPEFLKAEPAPSFPVARVLLTLALLVGALYYIRPLLKKTKWGGAPLGGPGLDVLSRVYLGPKAGLCLIRAEGRKLLVSISADGVRLLADLGSETTDTAPHA
jgi:flagellar biogenesis protein FliO